MGRSQRSFVLVIVLALLMVATGCGQAPAQPLAMATQPPPTPTLVAPTATPLPATTPVPPTPTPPPTATQAPPTVTPHPTSTPAPTSKPTSAPTATPEPQAQVVVAGTEETTFPIGTFTMQDHDGKWLVIFKDDGGFTVSINGRPMVRRGSYIVSQDQITLSDDSAPCAGKGDGTYRWTFDGTILTWEVVSDRCIARKGTHHASEWTKRP